MKNKYFNIFYLLAIPIFGFAQTITETQLTFLEAVHEQYATASSFSMNIEISAFDSNNNLVMPIQENRSIKSGEQYLIETPAVINMITEECQLVVDHGNQIIQLNPLTKEAKKELEHKSLEQAFPAREILEKDSTLTVKETEEILQLITIEPLSLNKYVYTFNKETKILEQVDYYLTPEREGQPAHVRIRYQVVSVNKEIPSETFSLASYLRATGEGRKLVEAFESYTLIDNTKAK